MFKNILALTTLVLVNFTLLPGQGFGQKMGLLDRESQGNPEIMIRNRVLAKVNDKPITVLDCVKKMDMVFFKQYPQFTSNPLIRYQFYNNSWRAVLEELIDKELMLADAEQLKMEVSTSDMRQELETMFGPNIISNLDQAGLTMDEAMQLLHDETIFKRMMYFRVNAKALKDVTPNVLRQAYVDYLTQYDPNDIRHFHVITIKDVQSENLDKIAESLSLIIKTEEVSLEDLPSRFRKIAGVGPLSSIKVSEEFVEKEKALSPSFLEALTAIDPGQYSELKSSSKEGVKQYKFFYLKDLVVDIPPPFTEMASKFKNDLLSQKSIQETKEYKKKLRQQYPIAILDIETFEPFTVEVNGKKIDVDALSR